MQGNIDFIGQLTGDISGGGGGGGDVMDVKVKTSSQYESVVNEEDKTAYIDLSSYVKHSELSSYVTSEALTIILNDYVTDSELSTALSYYVTQSELSTELTSYQPKLTAGENITINPVTNVISASGGGGSWDYSTSEVNTGQKWTDGKDIYCKVFNISPLTMSTGGTWYATGCVIPNIDKLINVICSGGGDTSYGSITADYSNDNINLINFRIAIVDTITAFYTKSI